MPGHAYKAKRRHTAARPAVDLAALRTDLQTLELTAEQLDYVGRAGQ
ncbi:hypothetical protein [Streptomyces sp. NRRL S-1448]|nr:hypothetical protein [Streptomyces sp. NRRL S-1448]